MKIAFAHFEQKFTLLVRFKDPKGLQNILKINMVEFLIFGNSSVSPEQWQDFSNDNINYAERERMNSVDLRSSIDGLLQQTSNDMRKQVKNFFLPINTKYWHFIVWGCFQLFVNICSNMFQEQGIFQISKCSILHEFIMIL